MLGPRGHRSPQSGRRDRRRIVIAVVVTVILAIVIGEVINDVVKSSTPSAKRAKSTWISVVSAYLTESNSLSPMLHDVRSHATDAASFDRVTLELELGNLVRIAGEEDQSLDQLRLGAPTAREGLLLAEIFAWRAEGFSDLAHGVALAIAPAAAPTAGAAALAAAGSHFVAADSGYTELVKLLGRPGDADRAAHLEVDLKSDSLGRRGDGVVVKDARYGGEPARRGGVVDRRLLDPTSAVADHRLAVQLDVARFDFDLDFDLDFNYLDDPLRLIDDHIHHSGYHDVDLAGADDNFADPACRIDFDRRPDHPRRGDRDRP